MLYAVTAAGVPEKRDLLLGTTTSFVDTGL
jgi:ABC-type tungstate transport system permease subunit